MALKKKKILAEGYLTLAYSDLSCCTQHLLKNLLYCFLMVWDLGRAHGISLSLLYVASAQAGTSQMAPSVLSDNSAETAGSWWGLVYWGLVSRASVLIVSQVQGSPLHPPSMWPLPHLCLLETAQRKVENDFTL